MFHTIFAASLRAALQGISIGKDFLGAPAAIGDFILLEDGLYRVSGIVHQNQGENNLPWAIVNKVPTPDKLKVAQE